MAAPGQNIGTLNQLLAFIRDLLSRNEDTLFNLDKVLRLYHQLEGRKLSNAHVRGLLGIVVHRPGQGLVPELVRRLDVAEIKFLAFAKYSTLKREDCIWFLYFYRTINVPWTHLHRRPKPQFSGNEHRFYYWTGQGSSTSRITVPELNALGIGRFVVGHDPAPGRR